jgi:hypothetical protein
VSARHEVAAGQYYRAVRHHGYGYAPSYVYVLSVDGADAVVEAGDHTRPGTWRVPLRVLHATRETARGARRRIGYYLVRVAGEGS